MNKNKMLWGSDRNAVIALLAINLIVFVFFRMLFIIFQNNPAMQIKDYNSVIINFGLHSNASIFIQKIWTLVTYFFTNTTFLNLTTNMIWLFALSYFLQQYVNNSFLFPSYIYGGIVGGIAYIITAQFGNMPSLLLGSAPAIMGIAGCLLCFAPHQKLLHFIDGGIPLWIFIIIYLLIDGANCLVNNPLLLIVHFTGFGAGYGFAYLVKKDIDLGKWMHSLYDYILDNNFTKSTK